MQVNRGLSTKVTDEDIANGVKDEFGAIYSPDGKRLLRGVNSASYCIKPETQMICDSAFDFSRGLTSISIPDTVTHIGKGAFSGCSGLTSIEIPDNVTIIDDDAFNGCSNLTNLFISNSVTHIGFQAFFECTSLTSVVFPASVTYIGHNAFDCCINLKSVSISSPIIYIGIWAFYGCRNLKSVTFGYSSNQYKHARIRVEISEMAFMNCPIKSLKIPLNNEEQTSNWFK